MNIEIKDGIVTNDGYAIATIEGDVCTLETKAAPAIKGAINKEAGRKLAFVVVGDELEAPEPEVTLTLAQKISLGAIVPPSKHPAMGDKDPAYVAWCREHATPEEFARLYPASRKLPTHAEFIAGERKHQSSLPGEKADKGN